MHRLVGDSEQEIRTAAADWRVEFLPDPDGDMNEGDLLVDSELVLPASPDLGVGERTRRITTVHAGQQTTTHEQSVNRTTPVQIGPVFARIVYDDDAWIVFARPELLLPYQDRRGRPIEGTFP